MHQSILHAASVKWRWLWWFQWEKCNGFGKCSLAAPRTLGSGSFAIWCQAVYDVHIGWKSDPLVEFHDFIFASINTCINHGNCINVSNIECPPNLASKEKPDKSSDFSKKVNISVVLWHSNKSSSDFFQILACLIWMWWNWCWILKLSSNFESFFPF